MKVFDLPDVVNECIFNYLKFADICRLRLSSLKLNSWATQFLKDKASLKLVVTEETSFNFQFLMNLCSHLGLPIKQLGVQTTSGHIYSDPTTLEFTSKYGSGIQELKISTYFNDFSPQHAFLDSLCNLQELEIINMDTEEDDNPSLDMFPSCFKNLKSLKFGDVSKGDTWKLMIVGSPRLNYICFPKLANFDAGIGQKYEALEALIHLQITRFPNNPDNLLKEIDLRNLNNPETVARDTIDFLNFFQKVKTLPLAFVNISSEYFANFTVQGYSPYDKTFRCIRSMILNTYFRALCHANFDGIQELNIPSIRAIYPGWKQSPLEQDWVNLKSLSVHFNFVSKEQSYQDLIHSLLVGPNPQRRIEQFTATFDPAAAASVLSGKKISASLPYLKKLTLVNWNPPNTAFIILWQNLPLLEELWLENCPSLGNVALIGNDESNPGFLKLQKLTKLTLVLDDSPKLTDRAFKDVLRHMKLKEFHIKSKVPLTSITKVGINWLLNGDFGNTIQKFPFDTWSVSDISSEEWQNIKTKFKSVIS